MLSVIRPNQAFLPKTALGGPGRGVMLECDRLRFSLPRTGRERQKEDLHSELGCGSIWVGVGWRGHCIATAELG